MKIYTQFTAEIAESIKNGGVGVIPTDTLYGIVGSAMLEKSVEKIYTLRQRDRKKPMIILLSDVSEIEQFSVSLSKEQLYFLKKIWPNAISVIFRTNGDLFRYLHRGTNTLAFRIPNDGELLSFLSQAGSLVAPSVNIEGHSPASSMESAYKFFGEQLDFYLDAGNLQGDASTVIELLEDGKHEIVREGVVSEAELDACFIE